MGVSNKATRSLNKNPFNNKMPNRFHSITPKEHNKNNTEKVSRNCEVMVEKLFRSHKCRPFVLFFQKW